MTVLGKLAQAALFLCQCAYLLRCYFAPRKQPVWKQAVCHAGCWAVLAAVWRLGDSIAYIAVAALVAGIQCWALYDVTLWKSGFFGLLMGVLQAMAVGIGLLFYHAVDGLDASALPVLEITAAFLLAALSGLFNDQWRASYRPMLLLLPVWLVAVLLCGEILRIKSYRELIALNFLALVWLSYAHAQLIRVCGKMEDQVRQRQQAQQTFRHYVQQEEYYQQLLNKQTETRALWHDLNKYLRAAKAESPSSQALSQMESLLNSATQIVDVGNRVVSVILNEYAQAAKAAGTELRLKVTVPEELFVSAADLYVLIGNTMDNALEACKDLPSHQRLIDLTLRTHNDVLYYKLVNPYHEESRFPQNDPARGYGLRNVRRCLQTYGGNMEITRENGFFTVFAHLNKP